MPVLLLRSTAPVLIVLDFFLLPIGHSSFLALHWAIPLGIQHFLPIMRWRGFSVLHIPGYFHHFCFPFLPTYFPPSYWAGTSLHERWHGPAGGSSLSHLVAFHASFHFLFPVSSSSLADAHNDMDNNTIMLLQRPRTCFCFQGTPCFLFPVLFLAFLMCKNELLIRHVQCHLFPDC